MSAENNLYIDMIDGFNKIGECEISKEINFIILFDGIKNDLYPDDMQFPSVYEMKKGMKYSTAIPTMNFGEAYDDLTNKKNLIEILKFIKKMYCAKQYGYIYSGHGGAGEGDISNGIFHTKIDRVLPNERDENGDVLDEIVEKRLTIRGWAYEGYCELEENKNIILVVYSRNSEVLTYKGLNDRLDYAFPNKELSFIFLDTCWGMMIENCYTFKNTAKYFVATIDEMPSTGVGYNDLINLLNKRPQIEPQELSKLLVAVNYANNYADYDCGREEFKNMGISLTCIDTQRIAELIKNYFNPFCDYLIKNISKKFLVFKKATEQCKDYTYVDYSKPGHEDYGVYNIDLIWFLENILYYNTKLASDNEVIDRDLQVLTYRLIQEITLYLFKSSMSNNYEEPQIGTMSAIGGKGLAITLPKNGDQLENSIYYKKSGAPNFVNETQWKELITIYIKHIRDLKAEIMLDAPGFFNKNWASIKGDEYFINIFNYKDVGFEKEVFDKKNYDQYKAYLFSADTFGLEQKWGVLKKPNR